MMRKKRKTDALVVLVLFGVFAVCILSVLLTGADAYQRLSQRDGRSYDRRTAAQYLSTRIRQADRLGSVSVEDFGGVDALIFREDIGGDIYETAVYCYDGWLRELFTAEDSGMLPEDGERVLEAECLELTLDGQTVLAELTDPEGETLRLNLYLRSREGAAE